MKIIILLSLALSSLNMLGQIEQFEDAPKKKRVIDTVRFRHFSIETNLTDIAIAKVNLGISFRPIELFEV
jgi:hypothetical protein